MIREQTKHAVVTLTATSKSGAIRRHELADEQGIFVGKSSNCGFQLDGEGLSDIHCRIGFDEGEVWVQDWMSSEGTRLNGEEITSNEKVDVLDVIKVGIHEIRIAYGRLASVADAEPDAAEKAPAAEAARVPSRSPAASRSPEPAPAPEQTPAPEPTAVAEPASAPQPTAVVEPAPATKPTVVADSATSVEPQVTIESTPAAHSPVVAENSTEELTPDDPSTVAEELIRRLEDAAETTDEEASVTDFSADFFEFEEEETYDRETVALLQAEIEELQTQLAQRDAERGSETCETPVAEAVAEESDQVMQRMQDLIDEASRSDEQIAILEELLHAAEDASRSETEERAQLEAWVGDIEKRVGQREEEHVAELDALRNRLEKASEQQERLQQQLRHAATSGSAPKHYEDTLENLQETNRQLQDQLAEAQKQCRVLEQRIEQQAEAGDEALRAERAAIAQEQAKIARLRFELSSKLSSIEEMPKSEHSADRETAHRIQTLRQHLREIHEQEKKEEKEASLTTRLAKLWKRTEY